MLENWMKQLFYHIKFFDNFLNSLSRVYYNQHSMNNEWHLDFIKGKISLNKLTNHKINTTLQ